jgi:putative aldouronate transport system substrate-binding protein
MQKVSKRILVLVLLSLVLVPMVFARGGAEPQTGGAAEPEHLVMYLLGDPARDQDMIMEQLNEMTVRDLNATLEINFIPWSDYESKYQLLLASGEDFDLIYASNWIYFTEYARDGAFLPIEDLLPEYAPETWTDIPEIGWQQSSVNGHIFLVPKNYEEFGGQGLLYRLDLAQDNGLDRVDSIDTMVQYFEIVKKAMPDVLPLNLGTEGDIGNFALVNRNLPSADYGWMHNLALDSIWISMDNPEEPIFLYETQLYRDYLDLMRQGTEAGYWSRNALSNNVRSRDAFLNGVSASSVVNPTNAGEDYERLIAKNPDWELDYWDFESGYGFKPQNSLTSDGMAVNRNAAHPELAIQLLNKLHSDEDYYNLTWYGIEGVHWELNDDGYLTFPDGVSADTTGYPWGETCPWGWTEQKFHKKSAGGWSVMEELEAQWRETARLNPYDDFAFNVEPVNAEMAALSQLEDEYARPLEAGVVEDVEAGYEELLRQMELGGIQKVIAEVTRQWTAYLESKE